MKTCTYLAILSCCYLACTSSPKLFKLQGQTQGTTYAISYHGSEARNYQIQVDSIFEVINQSLSTYQPTSTIVRFNQSNSFQSNDRHFLNMLEQSQAVYQQTEGAFDPTIMPLVKAWGFGPDNSLAAKIGNFDSLRQLVGFGQIRYAVPDESGGYLVSKNTEGIQLDFNAIAQGYTVDEVADFLEKRGIENYLVEIGGEVKAKGKNAKGNLWALGIEKPDELQIIGIHNLAAIIELDDVAIATSGSYHKFYLKDGVKYSHTIDPHTGYPVTHNLLSVTVMTDQAAKADAYATAFMVWGKDEAMTFIRNRPELNIEAYFISDGGAGKLAIEATAGMEAVIRAD